MPRIPKYDRLEFKDVKPKMKIDAEFSHDILHNAIGQTTSKFDTIIDDGKEINREAEEMKKYNQACNDSMLAGLPLQLSEGSQRAQPLINDDEDDMVDDDEDDENIHASAKYDEPVEPISFNCCPRRSEYFCCELHEKECIFMNADFNSQFDRTPIF